MEEKKIKHYSTNEDGMALIRPNGSPVYYIGEAEDNSFYRDHSSAWVELDMLLDALNKYGRHTTDCIWYNDVVVDCNCGWEQMEKALLIKD